MPSGRGGSGGRRPSVGGAIDVDGARKVFKLVDAPEDSADVQNVWISADAPDEVPAALHEE